MRKPGFLSVMVVFSLLLCILYGVAAVVFQYWTGEELSPTLTENWYKVFGIEIAGTTIIYMTKRITSIWKLEDKLDLKKKNGLPVEPKDFNSDETVYDTYEEDPEIYG